MRKRVAKKARATKRKKSFLKERRFWYAFVVLVAVLGGFYVAYLSPALHIQEVRVRGNQTIATDKVQRAVWEHAWTKVFSLSTQSILAIDKQRMAENLSSSFPGFQSVALTRVFPHTLRVEVKERVQTATWCSGERCYALDKEGIIFRVAERNEVFPVVSLNEPEAAQLGERVVQKDVLEELLRFQEQAELFFKDQLRVSELSRVSQDLVEAQTSEGWYIFFNPREDLNWQLTKLQIVLDQKIPAERRGELEYVDLRFGDQAYLKYQDEHP